MKRQAVHMIVSCLIASGAAAVLAAQAPAVPAASRVADALAAMGGEARLTSLKSLKLESIGHTWALEQSERPEGPWLSNYQQAVEIRDFEHDRRWLQNQIRNWNCPSWCPATVSVIAGGVSARSIGPRWITGTPADIDAMRDAYALSPERLLLTAKAAADLRAMPDQLQQKVNQHVVAFTFGTQRIRLFLNAWTHLPTMMEITRVDSNFSSWGDVVYRRWYSYWTLEKGQLLYPRQVTTEWNGFPYSDVTVQALTVDGPVDEAPFAIPEDTKAAFAVARPAVTPVIHFDPTRAVAINDWITQVPAGYNVAFIRQPDGLVVLESVGTPDYSASVLDYLAKQYPGVPVKALVTTSDAWPHFGGVREYVARGIPIYALDLNVSILTRMVNAKRTIAPDRLAREPKAPIFRPVSARTVVGSGDTRIELLPVRGETGERMMLAWLPGARLLYSSDLIQHSGPPPAPGFFMPMMLAEVEAVVAREKLEGVERIFGMHMTPRPWSDVVAAIRAATGGAATTAPASTGAAPTAGQLLSQAIAAMGGEARLTGIKSLTLDSIGHTWAIEQSERPEGPWLATYTQSVDTRDFEHNRRKLQTQRRNWSFPAWSPWSFALLNGDLSARGNGQQWVPGLPADAKAVADLYALAPEHLLFTARAAADVKMLPPEVQQKVKQDVIGFTWNGQPMRVFLNAWTHLPTLLEITRNETRFAHWGDATERRWYTFWTLEKGGLMYPRQTTTEWNGFPYSDETVQMLKVDEPLDDAAMTIPEATKAAIAAGRPAAPPPVLFNESRAVDVADWIVEVPGGYNVSIVKQPDGLLIIEAATSTDHADATMAFATRRFPGLPIKGVVTTSDAWPHIGGIRAYVAKGLPIYALDLNVSILMRFIDAKHTLEPDALSRAPKAPVFRPVTAKTTVGTGATRVELIPVRGETGERMMLAWIPGAHVLYTSDLIQRASRPTPDVPFFNPSMLMEVEAAATREHLDGIERAFGMHLVPTPWAEIVDAVNRARAR